VAAELRALLHEELGARARESGRPADEALALVRGYGPPGEVAARYHPARAIIDPADTTNFLRASFIGTGALILLSVLRRYTPSRPETDDDAVGRWVLDWLGLLLLGFGLKGWIRQRWPSAAPWKPRDRDRVSRVGTAVMVPFATLVLIFYAAPARVLDLVSGGRIDTGRVEYTADFQRLRLPWFIGCLAGLLALQAFAAVRGRRNWLIRRVGIGLNLALACMALAFAVDGNLFQSEEADRIARDVLALVAVVYVPCVGVMIYGEIGRVDRRAVITKAASPPLPGAVNSVRP
jgi:hypothetical protein